VRLTPELPATRLRKHDVYIRDQRVTTEKHENRLVEISAHQTVSIPEVDPRIAAYSQAP